MTTKWPDHKDCQPLPRPCDEVLWQTSLVFPLFLPEMKMAQNIYDNPDFFAGYSQLPRQVHGLNGAPEWPAIRALLPDVKDRRVADLGCGFGWASRWFREQGAASVLGLDLSRNMIERARADTADTSIDYRIADLETLELPHAAFDLVYSALTFHYIKDFGRLVSMIHNALTSCGDLVFTIEHPIFMAAAHPHWLRDEDGRKTWPVNGYSSEGERRTDWFAKGVLKQHRTLATTLNTLISAGFTLRKIGEFAPTPEQIRAMPSLAEELERPMMLLIAARKN
ncbi:class I SAM-dependent methyltransferase [Paracoccus litorisediminis]|nr:class I SAM-dependent methyltransferase [Paracoccus litorisediminis]